MCEVVIVDAHTCAYIEWPFAVICPEGEGPDILFLDSLFRVSALLYTERVDVIKS